MSTGITNVEPVSLPSAAGIAYAGGDVQHPSPTTDPLNADVMARATRQLAERDNLLASKVNDLVAVVNNKDQFIPFPVPPVTVPPGGSTIVGTYRIPPGYEARVLNAIIGSTPFGVGRLDILYSEGTYGNITGATVLVSTLSEFTAGTSFQRSGELVVRYVNTSGRSALVTASVMLTMRPVGAQKGGIIGPGAVGAQGPAGVKGDKGDPGSPGVPGATGPAGLNWRGAWDGATAYAIRDAVRHDNAAYYALAASVGQTPPDPSLAPSAYWDLVAYGPQGAQGVQGAQGIGLVWSGTWDAGSVYTFNDAVYYGPDGNSYISVGAVNTGTAPPISPFWDRLISAELGPEGPQGPQGPQGSERLALNFQSGTEYTLELFDEGALVLMDNGSANQVIVPLYDDVPFSEGARVEVCQFGTGATTITPYDGSVQIHAFMSEMELQGQYRVGTLTNLGSNEWLLAHGGYVSP